MSVWVGIAILVPVAGALLYAMFAGESNRAKKAGRLTAFGEAPPDHDEEFDLLGRA